MKKFFRKTMFALSFLGLFTFGVPNQTKADAPSKYPCTILIVCPDGHGQYVFCEDEEAYLEAYLFICRNHFIIIK